MSLTPSQLYAIRESKHFDVEVTVRAGKKDADGNNVIMTHRTIVDGNSFRSMKPPPKPNSDSQVWQYENEASLANEYVSLFMRQMALSFAQFLRDEI